MDNLDIKVESVSDKTKAFLRADLAQTKEDIEAIEGLFLETACKGARHSGDVAKGGLPGLWKGAKVKSKSCHKGGQETGMLL